jgi:hypothetical protein
MSRYSYYLVFGSIILFLFIGCKNTFALKPMEIYPQKAVIVLTEESWGCITRQHILSDVTGIFSGNNKTSAQIDEIINSEDRDNRQEIYLYFPAKDINSLPGYYILRIGVKHLDSTERGSIVVNQAKLNREGNTYSFELSVNVQGTLSADLFYSRHETLQAAFFSCPEAGDFSPYKTAFLRMFAVKTNMKFNAVKKDAAWSNIVINVPQSLFADASNVDACEELLDRLDKELLSSEHIIFLWDDKMMTRNKIETIVNALKQEKGLHFDLSIKINDKGKLKEINIGQQLFNPQIKQQISIKKSNGQIVGGEIWINIKQSVEKRA